MPQKKRYAELLDGLKDCRIFDVFFSFLEYLGRSHSIAGLCHCRLFSLLFRGPLVLQPPPSPPAFDNLLAQSRCAISLCLFFFPVRSTCRTERLRCEASVAVVKIARRADFRLFISVSQSPVFFPFSSPPPKWCDMLPVDGDSCF